MLSHPTVTTFLVLLVVLAFPSCLPPTNPPSTSVVNPTIRVLDPSQADQIPLALADPSIDVVRLRGGVYVLESNLVLLPHPHPGTYRVFESSPGERAVLDASGLKASSTWAISLKSASWWTVRGLEVKNNPWGGGIALKGTSSHNLIEGNDVHHHGCESTWAATGISLFETAANNLVLNNDSHHNADKDYDDADGIGLNANGPGNVARGNRLWNNSDDGFDLFNVYDNSEGATYVLEDNWAWNNGYGENGQVLGDGNGFKLGGLRANTTSTSGGHTVRNNLAWGNVANGFDENNASKPSVLEHNTAWNNGANFAFFRNQNTFTRNLSLTPGGTKHSGVSTDNSWDLVAPVEASAILSFDATTAVGPRGPHFGLPSSDFLRPKVGSPDIGRR